MSILCHHENILQNPTLNVSKLMINHYCKKVNRIFLGKRQIRLSETDPMKKKWPVHGTLSIANAKLNGN